MEQTLQSGGVLWRMLGAWADLRGAMRAELERDPSEGRLLFYVMLSGLIWFFGQVAILAYGPLAPTMLVDEFTARVAWEFITSVLVLPLFYYALAAIFGAIARGFGGTGDWHSCRAATFWAALVAAPAILAAKLLALLLGGVLGQGMDIAGTFGSLALAWTTAHCFAEAHGFTSVWRVLAAIAGLAAAFAGGVYTLGHL